MDLNVTVKVTTDLDLMWGFW